MSRKDKFSLIVDIVFMVLFTAWILSFKFRFNYEFKFYGLILAVGYVIFFCGVSIGMMIGEYLTKKELEK